jgi:SOS-response transcriptional repressor LexA
MADKGSTLRVLEIIRSEVDATGRMPTPSMIRDEMEWKTTSGVIDVMIRLARNGYIRRIKEDGPLMQRYELVT